MVNRKKKKKLNQQVSIYNPNGNIFLPGRSSLPERPGADDHEYASIEDTLVYTHLLRKGMEIGVYGDFDTYRPFSGPTEPHRAASVDSTQDSKWQFQKPPPVPVRPLSHDQRLVDNVIYQAEGQTEEEHSLELGPRMEPEGGDWEKDWIWFSTFHLTYLNSEIFFPWHPCDCLIVQPFREAFVVFLQHQRQAHEITPFPRLPCCTSHEDAFDFESSA